MLDSHVIGRSPGRQGPRTLAQGGVQKHENPTHFNEKDKAKRLNSKAMNCNRVDRKWDNLAVPRTEHTPAV